MSAARAGAWLLLPLIVVSLLSLGLTYTTVTSERVDWARWLPRPRAGAGTGTGDASSTAGSKDDTELPGEPRGVGRRAPRAAVDDGAGEHTHVSCQVLPDGFSLCYYENACFKMNSKEVGLLGAPVVHDRLPASAGAWDDDGARELAFADWVPERPPAEDIREAEARVTAAALADANVRSGGSSGAAFLDFTYKDTAALDVAFRPLLAPVQHLKEAVARPVRMWEPVARPTRVEEAVPRPLGGGGGGGGGATVRGADALRDAADDPPVPAEDGAGGTGVAPPPPSARIGAYSPGTRGAVWVESLWVADAVYAFKQHLWALGATVTFPVLAALVANASAHLRLPPLEVLLVSTELRPAARGDTLGARFGWNGELLRVLLETATGAEPTTGRQAWGGGSGGGAGVPPAAFLRAPAAARGATVVLSQRDDLPWGGGGAPPAVCAARAVVLGHKPAFLGGAADANALRYLLGPPLRLAFPYPGSAEVATRRVRALVIDRDAADRPFANPGDVLAVLALYKVDTTYLSGAEYGRLGFGEQARLFNAHNVIVAAHGAALSNVVFCPPRSVVIEVYPRGVWKPTYARVAAGAGHAHLPVFAFEPGGPRHADAPWVPPVDTGACSKESFPRITRDACYPWLRALPVLVPKPPFEQAVVAALNLAGFARVEGRWRRRQKPARPPARYTPRPNLPSAAPRPAGADAGDAGGAAGGRAVGAGGSGGGGDVWADAPPAAADDATAWRGADSAGDTGDDDAAAAEAAAGEAAASLRRSGGVGGGGGGGGGGAVEGAPRSAEWLRGAPSTAPVAVDVPAPGDVSRAWARRPPDVPPGRRVGGIIGAAGGGAPPLAPPSVAAAAPPAPSAPRWPGGELEGGPLRLGGGGGLPAEVVAPSPPRAPVARVGGAYALPPPPPMPPTVSSVLPAFAETPAAVATAAPAPQPLLPATPPAAGDWWATGLAAAPPAALTPPSPLLPEHDVPHHPVPGAPQQAQPARDAAPLNGGMPLVTSVTPLPNTEPHPPLLPPAPGAQRHGAADAGDVYGARGGDDGGGTVW